MVGYVSREVREGLEAARKRGRKTTRRMRLEVGGESLTILRYWETGFALEAGRSPIRGLVDVYEGSRHVSQGLVVASTSDEEETVYEFKRNTAAVERPPVDFVRDEDAPVGLLPKPG